MKISSQKLLMEGMEIGGLAPPNWMINTSIGRKKKGRWIPYEVIYFDEMSEKGKIVKERTIYYDLATTTNATNEQKTIFGEKVFDTNKPVDLIKRLILLSTTPNSIILDSFAGSGTTAHAVLALNKEDGGNRRFILVECEKDYADTITAERVRRVIQGVPTARNQQLKEGLGGSFAYCTLGEPVDVDSLLAGQDLPSFSTLAAYLLYTASGISAHSYDLLPKGTDGHFYSGNNRDYYLIYEPNLDFLRSNDAALNQQRAEHIHEEQLLRQRPAVVFAPAKYIGQRQLSQWNITFCQLPYELLAKVPGD